MTRSKKINDRPDLIYCRRCCCQKAPNNFYTATDEFLDKNGYMSICKSCIGDIYNILFASNQNMEKTILEMCRMLNISYNQAAVDATKAQLDTYAERGTKANNIYGIYKSKLTSTASGKIGSQDPGDLTFFEPSSDVIQEINTFEDEKDLDYYQDAWGFGFDMDDYLYLENEYSKLIKRTEHANYAEEIYARQICYALNQMRKDRDKGILNSKSVKVFQDLMKDSALTPSQQTAATTGKNADSFGAWIKDIETTTPAEWYDKHEKFHDMEGMEDDLEEIKRAIKNFITGSRDFTTMDLEGVIDFNIDTGKKKKPSKEKLNDKKTISEGIDE